MKPKAEGNYAAIPDDQVCVASLFDPAAAVAQMSCKYRMETTGMRDSNGRELTQKLAKSCLQVNGGVIPVTRCGRNPFDMDKRLSFELQPPNRSSSPVAWRLRFLLLIGMTNTSLWGREALVSNGIDTDRVGSVW